MRARAHPARRARLLVRAWPDPVIDQVGHDPRSVYVERFWLGILGPSATWLVRHLVDRLDAPPTASSSTSTSAPPRSGSAVGPAPHGRVPAHAGPVLPVRRRPPRSTPATLQVRRRLPPLTRRQLARLPEPLQADARPAGCDSPAGTGGRRRHSGATGPTPGLALSLVELGEDGAGTERQLHHWRFPRLLASEATAWALGRHVALTPARRHRGLDPDDRPGGRRGHRFL